MAISRLTFRSPDEVSRFFMEETGMIPGYRQLSRGPAQIDYLIVDLDGVLLMWCTNPAHALWRDDMHPEGRVQLGFLVESACQMRVRGEDISPDHALMWMAGQEMEYAHPGAVATLEVSVDRPLADALGWWPAGTPLARTRPGSMSALLSVARAVTHAVQAPGSPPDITTRHRFRERILRALEPVLAPWLDDGDDPDGKTASHYALFRRAEAAFETRSDARLGVDALADAVGVSRRSLFLAFQKSIGAGPRRFFEVKRLLMLREALQLASDENETVTSLATELDFTDLGRMAGKYRAMFDENPSQTLARRA